MSYHTEIIQKHGVRDGYDNDRLAEALRLKPFMDGETLEDVFITLVALEKKGLLDFRKPETLNHLRTHIH